jgi:hypothetical protein
MIEASIDDKTILIIEDDPSFASFTSGSTQQWL